MNDPQQSLIQVAGLTKAYRTPAGAFYALKDIDLEIWPGEFVAVVGKSGAGKSTLVNMVTGIDRPTAGQVRVGEHAVHKMNEDRIAGWRGRSVGVIFQFFQLLPMLTCAQNVMLPMDFAGLYGSSKEQRERALYLLDQVGIVEQADKLPSAVSGGQRQRVAIARALAPKPRLVLADEPTASLDTDTALEIVDLFVQLNREHKATILFSTHDPRVLDHARRLIRVQDGRLSETPVVGKA